MEVCGGHTITIFKYGIRKLLPSSIELISGPGCPVCVTSIDYIDRAIAISAIPHVIITTFGDMMRVPGSVSSLLKEKARGRDIRICYAPMDAMEIARQNPEKEVVFLGIGFETTAPGVASVMRRALEQGIQNFSVLSAHKTMPNAMKALVEGGELALNAFLCPGHVTAITGSSIYQFLARDFQTPCVISGFEPVDMLQSIWMIVKQIAENRSEVENQYTRGVREEGNARALALLDEVFQPVDALWRGLGVIPDSGLIPTGEFRTMDANTRFSVTLPQAKENPRCICGDIMRGAKNPLQCPLFAKGCHPDDPKGSCMVSDEGTCATYFKYERR